MDKQYANWQEYWKNDDFWIRTKIFKLNLQLYMPEIQKIIHLNKSDSVLNIGCGLGYFEELLSPLVKDIYSIDISKNFIEICKKRCSNYKNITFSTMGSDYTDLAPYGKPFFVIFCIDVVQYYKNIAEVESLILSAKKIASKGAKMFIINLPVERSKAGFLWDSFSSLLLSIKRGYFFYLIKVVFIMCLFNSSYKSFYKSRPQLYFSEKDIKLLINRMKLDAKIIKKSLSVYANRLNLLIQF